MAKRTGRTLAQVEAERANNARQRQDYLKKLAREEQKRDQDAATEAAHNVIDEYRERRPAPPKGNAGREHSPIAPDSRLGYLRNNPQAMPLVPLAPPQNLGRHPDHDAYTESATDTTKRSR
jgi:hypothetical protein